MATVYNLGISGATSAQVLRDELPRALELKPEWAVVMAGTNDRINSYALVPASEYEANLRRIAEQLASAGIRVMLMTPPPCIEEYLYTRHPKAAYGGHTPADRLLEAGAIVKKLAAEFNAPCVDVHAVIGTDPANLIRTVANCGQPDGVHLLPAGYRAIAEAVFAKFRELGIRPASVACLGDSLTFGHPRVEGGTPENGTYPAVLSAKLTLFS